MRRSLGVFTLRVVCADALEIHQLQLMLSYLRVVTIVVSPCGFLLLSAHKDSHSPVCLCLGGNGLPRVLSFPTDPGRVVDFPSPFRFFLVRMSDDFQKSENHLKNI